MGIDKGLAIDDIFLESVENIYNMGKDEIKNGENNGEDLDIEEYWEIMKKEVIRMAKIREREIREQHDGRKYYLEGRYRIESEKKTQEQKVYTDKGYLSLLSILQSNP